MNKQIKSYLDCLEKQGCRVVRSSKGWMVYHPDGVTTFNVHETPSDHRSMKNKDAEIRRSGLLAPKEWKAQR